MNKYSYVHLIFNLIEDGIERDEESKAKPVVVATKERQKDSDKASARGLVDLLGGLGR